MPHTLAATAQRGEKLLQTDHNLVLQQNYPTNAIPTPL